jgi:hypothetical protein
MALFVIVPGSWEFQAILILTLAVVVVKIIVGISLGSKITKRAKTAGKLQIDFLFAMFMFFILAIISRILYMIFDFVLTEFNTGLYVQYVLLWKIASFLSQGAVAFLLLLVDKQFYNYRLKGILAYIIIAFNIAQLFWPVHIKADFDLISLFSLASVIGAVLLPIMFFSIGRRTPQIRKYAYMIAVGIILYILAAVIVMEAILAPLTVQFGNWMQVVAYLIASISKVVGLILLNFGVATFKS